MNYTETELQIVVCVSAIIGVVGTFLAILVSNKVTTGSFGLSPLSKYWHEGIDSERRMEDKVEINHIQHTSHPTIHTGLDVYHWPEFKALAKRLGIVWGAETTRIELILGLDEVVKVVHTYQNRIGRGEGEGGKENDQN